MISRRQHRKGAVAAICLALTTQIHPAWAAAKKTTEVATSTLLIPSVSTADGDRIHASVVSVDSSASLTTLNLRCVHENNDDDDEDAAEATTACAGGVFEDRLFVYGPATVSVELDGRDWGCAVTSTASPTCSAGSAASSPATTATITDDAWSTAVTITSGVRKLRRTRVVVTTREGGATVTSTITEGPSETGRNDDSALCRRKVGGHGSSGGDGVDGSSAGTTLDADDDGTGNSRNRGSNDPCSSASRFGMDSAMMGAISIISALGFVISLL